MKILERILFMKTFFLFTNEETETKVSNRRLLSHSLGLVGQNMAYSFLGRLFVYLNTVLGIPAAKTGIITGVSTLWDALNDPLVGSLMDHRRHKPGYKLRPFLLWTPPLIGIFITLMFVDLGLSEGQTIAYVMILYVLFDTLYSFQDTAIWGISSLSSPDSNERRRVIQWISIAAGAGGTIAGLFPVFKDLCVNSAKMSEKNAYLLFAVIFGFGGMMMAMLAYRMKEKVIDTAGDRSAEKGIESLKAMIKTIWNLRYNRTLIIICLARIAQSFSLTLAWEYFFQSEGIVYHLFGAEIGGDMAMTFYGYVMGIPGAILNFFAVPVINKLGSNKRLLVLAEASNIAARLIAFAVGSNERYKNISALLITMALIGSSQILTNMKAIAERSLLTNAVDEMELKTGERTEGITFSMQNFVSKLTGAIPKFIQGTMLSFMGFKEKIKGPDGEYLQGAALVNAQRSKKFLKYRWHQFILGPAIGAALYLIVILFLKDDPAHTAEVERQLQAKRAAAEITAE